MKKLQLFEGFINKRLNDTATNAYEGYLKLFFKDYIVYIYTYKKRDFKQGTGFYREILYASILDKIIFVNEMIYIKQRCYFDTDDNTFVLNDLHIKYEIIKGILEEDEDDLEVYRFRTKEDAIETLKKLDSQYNLDNVFKNKETLTSEQRRDLAEFITENIRDVSYMIDAEQFDII
jgi:hypothetical protein